MKGKIKQLRKKYLGKFFVHHNSAGSISICHVVKVYYSAGTYFVQTKGLYMNNEFNQRKVGTSDSIYHLEAFALKFKILREREWANKMVDQAVEDVKCFLDTETGYCQ